MVKSILTQNTLLTNNCTKPRKHAIDTITPHYMAWYTSAKQCCESFIPASRRASANYCIGKDGEIWLNVEEQNRAWTSGSAANDNRAITIECANYMDSPRYGVLPDATWQSLVNLCADICSRYNRPKIVYLGSADYTRLKSDEMLLTMHKWFQDTDCPGPWLSGQFQRLANEVNAKLTGIPVHIDKLIVDGIGGVATVTAMQRQLKTPQDGIISGQYEPNKQYFWGMTSIEWSFGGSQMVAEMQRRIGASSDGVWGKETSTKLQQKLVGMGYNVGSSGVDGYFGRDSVRGLQRSLNDERWL